MENRQKLRYIIANKSRGLTVFLEKQILAF